MKRNLMILVIVMVAVIFSGCRFGGLLDVGGLDSSDLGKKDYKGWITVRLGDSCEFMIPPTLEIQSDDYRKRSGIDKFYEKEKPSLERIVAQQRGLNQYDKGALSKFARVIVKRVPWPNGGLPKLGEHLQLTKEDLKYIDEVFYSDETLGKGLTDAKYVTLKSSLCTVKSVNDIECVYKYYETQMTKATGKEYPVVNKEEYLFFNDVEIYMVNISARANETKYWYKKGEDIRDVIYTIKFKK